MLAKNFKKRPIWSHCSPSQQEVSIIPTAFQLYLIWSIWVRFLHFRGKCNCCLVCETLFSFVRAEPIFVAMRFAKSFYVPFSFVLACSSILTYLPKSSSYLSLFGRLYTSNSHLHLFLFSFSVPFNSSICLPVYPSLIFSVYFRFSTCHNSNSYW